MMSDEEFDKAQRTARDLAGLLPEVDDNRSFSRPRKKRRKDKALVQQYTLFLFRC